MFWGEFPKEIRMEEEARFNAPTFRRYQKPSAKPLSHKIDNSPVYIIKPKCNDCPFEKVTAKTCKRCRCN